MERNDEVEIEYFAQEGDDMPKSNLKKNENILIDGD